MIYILFRREDKRHFVYSQASPAHPSDNFGRKFEDIRMLKSYLLVHIGDTLKKKKEQKSGELYNKRFIFDGLH
jgi:hypothetical protein